MSDIMNQLTDRYMQTSIRLSEMERVKQYCEQHTKCKRCIYSTWDLVGGDECMFITKPKEWEVEL